MSGCNCDITFGLFSNGPVFSLTDVQSSLPGLGVLDSARDSVAHVLTIQENS